MTSPASCYGGCYGPLATTNHSARNSYLLDDDNDGAGSRRSALCAGASDDRLPVGVGSRDQYYGPFSHQHRQQQDLGWFSVRNVLIPLNVGATTTAMPTTMSSHRQDEAIGDGECCYYYY